MKTLIISFLTILLFSCGDISFKTETHVVSGVDTLSRIDPVTQTNVDFYNIKFKDSTSIKSSISKEVEDTVIFYHYYHY